MPSEVSEKTSVRCASCGKNGKRVSRVTLRALVKDEYLNEITDGRDRTCNYQSESHSCCNPAAEETGYRFCGSPDCEVVYFAEERGVRFTKEQLRVPVGVKETAGERLLCYCFSHSVDTIKEELRTKGRSDALEDIRRKMKDPGCRCETENPSGSCCLGSVATSIEVAKKELSMAKSDDKAPNPVRSSTSRGEKFAMMGTVISSVIASSCCWLPLVLLAVGISGIGIATTLEAYRPLFIVVTLGFLGIAFYFTYRPKRAADAGHGCCATEPAVSDDCCATPGQRRFSMISLNKIMLWVVTALAVGFLLFPSYVGFLLGTADKPAVTANMNRAVLKVEGMTCEGCAAAVADAIRKVPGVLAVEVNYEKGQAIVGTDACCPAPRDAILKAMQAAGYTGTFLNDRADATNKGLRTGPPATENADNLAQGNEPKQTTNQGSDPNKQIVFKVDGLRCPAVKGIGCGHMLRPVLASLDKIDSVQASSTNYTGTMIRVSLTSATERAKVADEVRKVLTENNPVALSGDELKLALEKEQWRESWRVGELSAIEFRAIALYRIKTFAQAERLNKEATDKLTKIAEIQWERLTQEAKKEKATQPEDWGNRCKKSIPVVLAQAKEVLSDEQLERFKKALMTPCREGDRPEAPSAPIDSK